jgi:hypothetical protein
MNPRRTAGRDQGSMAPLVFGGISAAVGSAMLAFFIDVGFGD